jgi:hypothetical protein
VELRRCHLHYVHELIGMTLPLLDANASPEVRVYLRDLLWHQMDQGISMSNQTYVFPSFSHVKQALEQVRQQELSVLFKVSDSGREMQRTQANGPNEKLRAERNCRGWTHWMVANFIDLPDAPSVGRWERGTIFPRAHYREKLCQVFGMSLADLGLVVSRYRG